MSSPIDPDSLLTYVAGLADPDEALAIEAWLGSGSPAAAAAYAEAVSVFNAVPLALDPVDPPKSIRHAILGRIAADASGTSRNNVAGPWQWPAYISTGLAACMAVALSMSLWNNHVLSTRADTLSSSLASVQTQNQQMAETVAGSQKLMGSPHLSMVSLNNVSNPVAPNRPSGRVLFCPVSQLYQVTVFGLPPLPPDKAYELWLITPDQRKVPGGVFKLDDNGVATVMAHPSKVGNAIAAAVTDEPAGGSLAPTGRIVINGPLKQTN